MIKSYKVQCSLNKGKEEKILKIFKEYDSVAKIINNLQWYNFFQNGRFTNSKNIDIKNINGKISQRYKRNVMIQVTGTLDSYLSNRKNDFVKIVFKSNLDEEIIEKLLFINKYNLWFAKEEISYFENTKFIDIKTIKIAKYIIKHLIKINSKPIIKINSMSLNSDIVSITKNNIKKQHNDTKFEYWGNLSSLEKGKKINLPINLNSYININKNKVKNYIQITKKNKYLQFVICKEFDTKRDKYKIKTKEIGIDLGLRVLFTSSNKKFYGKNFIDELFSMDEEIVRLFQEKQKQNLTLSQAKKYKKRTKKLKEYLKNEINKYINEIVKKERPGKIILENLNFSSPKLSKRMNRILGNFGKSIIKKKFETLKEEYGIKIEYINPAYTSQECNSCGYVDKGNRQGQKDFCCIKCNIEANIKKLKLNIKDFLLDFRVENVKGSKVYYYKNKRLNMRIIKINADYNASKNILRRSSSKNFYNIALYSKREKVLNEIIKVFRNKTSQSQYSMVESFGNNYFNSKPLETKVEQIK